MRRALEWLAGVLIIALVGFLLWGCADSRDGHRRYGVVSIKFSGGTLAERTIAKRSINAQSLAWQRAFWPSKEIYVTVYLDRNTVPGIPGAIGTVVNGNHILVTGVKAPAFYHELCHANILPRDYQHRDPRWPSWDAAGAASIP